MTDDESEFHKKLAALLNECSMENGSDTPDFILARYLRHCLAAFDLAVSNRDVWYGTGLEPPPSEEGKT